MLHAPLFPCRLTLLIIIAFAGGDDVNGVLSFSKAFPKA